MAWLTILLLLVISTLAWSLPRPKQSCMAAKCPPFAFANLKHFSTSGVSDQACSCEDCTENGYSVCIRSIHHQCACAHTVPTLCLTDNSNENEKITEDDVVICYRDTLRNPPAPIIVENSNRAIDVQVPNFWRDDEYWKGITVKNLTVFYEFDVKSDSDCEAANEISVIESSKPGVRCEGRIRLQLEEDEDGLSSPEVSFEKDVFHGANHVEVYYEVGLIRPRQVVKHRGIANFEDRVVVAVSENLDMDPTLRGHSKRDRLQRDKKKSKKDDDDDDDDEDNEVVSKEDDDDNDKSKKNKKKVVKSKESSKSLEKSSKKSAKKSKEDEDEDEDDDDEDKSDDKKSGEDDDDDDDENAAEKNDDDDDDENEDSNENDGDSDEDDDDDDEEDSSLIGRLFSAELRIVRYVALGAVLFSLAVLIIFFVIRRRQNRPAEDTRREYKGIPQQP